MKSYFDDVNTKGFCLVKNFLSNRKVQEVNENLEKYLKIFNEGVVYEKNSSLFRAIHGPHLYAEFF